MYKYIIDKCTRDPEPAPEPAPEQAPEPASEQASEPASEPAPKQRLKDATIALEPVSFRRNELSLPQTSLCRQLKYPTCTEFKLQPDDGGPLFKIAHICGKTGSEHVEGFLVQISDSWVELTTSVEADCLVVSWGADDTQLTQYRITRYRMSSYLHVPELPAHAGGAGKLIDDKFILYASVATIYSGTNLGWATPSKTTVSCFNPLTLARVSAPLAPGVLGRLSTQLSETCPGVEVVWGHLPNSIGPGWVCFKGDSPYYLHNLYMSWRTYVGTPSAKQWQYLLEYMNELAEPPAAPTERLRFATDYVATAKFKTERAQQLRARAPERVAEKKMNKMEATAFLQRVEESAEQLLADARVHLNHARDELPELFQSEVQLAYKVSKEGHPVSFQLVGESVEVVVGKMVKQCPALRDTMEKWREDRTAAFKLAHVKLFADYERLSQQLKI